MQDARIKMIFDHIEPNGTCWQWTGRTQQGYAYTDRRGRNVRVHRVMYEATMGPIPEGKQLDHLCRNRGCVNPLHLDVCTLKENVLRGDGISAQNARKTHCCRGHALTPANIYTPPSRPRHRSCRECRKRTKRESARRTAWRRRQHNER